MPDEPSKNPLGELFEAMKATKRELGKVISERKAQEKESAILLAGKEWEKMSTGFSAALACMSSADPNVRKAALYVMAEHTEDRSEFTDICRTIATTDLDAGVRHRAMGLLSDAEYGLRNDDMKAFFARLVRDESAPLDDRRMAYMCLLDLFGRVHEFAPMAFDSALFPGSVDWELVDDLL
jgi:hypothetical protein